MKPGELILTTFKVNVQTHGLTRGAVKTRLHRARAALKTLLEPIMRGEQL